MDKISHKLKRIYLVLNKVFFSSLKNLKFIWTNRNKNFVFIHLQEHIGDIVACEPVIRYVKEKYPEYKIIWLVNPDYISILKCNPNIDNILTLTCIFEWILLKKFINPKKNVIIDLHIDKRKDRYFPIELNNPNKYGITLENYYKFGSLLESFSMAAGLPKLNIQPNFYLCNKNRKILDIDEDYIVIHTSSNEENRNWDKNKWKQLVNYLISRNFYVIEIGIDNIIDVKHTNYINFCGKKDLQDIANLIYRARLFIGIDSAFAHFANALKIPSVILLGYYRIFKNYMPYTGYLAENKEKMVIQYDGKPSEIPVKLVINKIENLLQ